MLLPPHEPRNADSLGREAALLQLREATSSLLLLLLELASFRGGRREK
jgi:hypothetical protein